MSNYWIQTFSGLKFDLLEPTEEMITIQDIAHHLAIENRFNGATKFPESVGYHSILVSEQLPDELKLMGLLHDAEEAYYKDITQPIKSLMKAQVIQYEMESWLLDAIYNCRTLIAEKFGFIDLVESYYKIVKEVDTRMCKTEKVQLCSENAEAWHPDIENAESFKIQILELQWRDVEREFLDLFYKLTKTL